MEIFNRYKEYKQYKPQYKNWKNQRNIDEAKKEAYIKQYGISDEQKQTDKERAAVVLNAIDIMDEYSQTRAENMEVATETFQKGITQLTSHASTIIGTVIGFCFPPVSNSLKRFGERTSMGIFANFIPAFAGVAISSLCLIPLITFCTKKEVEASRNGRYESMEKDLNNINHFAILTDKQKAEVEEKAKSIEIPKSESKKVTEGELGFIKGLLKSHKDLFMQDKTYFATRDKLAQKIKDDESKFETHKLSQEEIENAKKDKQLIGNIVEKIDIASQDYAENIEFATDTITQILLIASAGVGVLNHKIANMLSDKASVKAIGKRLSPKLKKAIKYIPTIAAVSASLVFAGSIAKIQTQASRIARFKVKDDLKNNPEKIFYVDDEKTKNMENYQVEKEKKQGSIAFIRQIFNDSKKYNEHMKTNNIKEKQRRKALENIKLTKEQEKEAKRLQANIFKTFTKVDEKSQTYAESVEAVGQLIKSYGSMALMGLGALIGYITGRKKVQLSGLYGMYASFIPIMMLNMHVTKEQKNASRVADMLALEELKDYKNYADYSTNPVQNKNGSNNKFILPKIFKNFLNKN